MLGELTPRRSMRSSRPPARTPARRWYRPRSATSAARSTAPRTHHGALATFDASFLTFGLGLVLDEATYAANRVQLGLLRGALAPADTGRQYLNFTEEGTDPARFYTRGGLPAPAGREGGGRPGQPLPGEPPDRGRVDDCTCGPAAPCGRPTGVVQVPTNSLMIPATRAGSVR